MYDKNVIYETSTVHWFTPRKVLSTIEKCFEGRIDLDPCGNSMAYVKARKIICPPNDGLQYFWRGNVFVNPPYGRGLERWYHKAWVAGRTGNARVIMLVPSFTETSTFQWFALRCSAICFWQGRIFFENRKNRPSQPPFGSALMLFGDALINRFIRTFRLHGMTWGWSSDCNRRLDPKGYSDNH